MFLGGNMLFGEQFAGHSSVGVAANMGPYDVMVMGASFGGTRAIEAILTELPADFPLPIAICQHITEGMTRSWAELLDTRCAINVVEATNRCPLQPGTAYIAPVGLQMRIIKGPLGVQTRLDPDFADSLHVPSIDMLFSSASRATGSGTLAVLLTGLGSDGATGMLQIRQAGGYTIGESRETAASYSMPGAAAELGGVVEQLPLDRVAARLMRLASRK